MNTKKKKKLLRLLIKSTLILSVIFMSACESDEVNTAKNGALKFSAKFDPNAASQARNLNEINISSFIVNIEEIEFEFARPEGVEGPYVSEIELKGPFELNLIENNEGLEETLTSLNLPEGNYEEVEFEIDVNKNPNSSIYEKSVVITGTVNGVDFEFWHDADLDVEAEFENGAVTFEEGRETLVNLQFDLTALFSMIDISNATDGNGDGIIQINPRDEDGNRKLADQIWDTLDDIVEAFEDSLENDDDDDDDDDK